MDAKLFWENIKKVLSEQGKTFVWLCEQAGVSVQVMKNRIYKERIPDVEDTLKLMAVLGTTVEEFFGVDIQLPPKVVVECAADTEKIPVFEQFFSCGKGQYVPETEYINGYIAIPEDLKTSDAERERSGTRFRKFRPLGSSLRALNRPIMIGIWITMGRQPEIGLNSFSE